MAKKAGLAKRRAARANVKKVEKTSKPGSGKRFAAVTKSIEAEGKSPAKAKAIAAAIGRKKYGAKGMAKMAAKGRKK